MRKIVLLIFFLAILNTAVSAYIISDDATGGECTSIGTWNLATKTCTLNVNLDQAVLLFDDSLTLDCDGHSIVCKSQYYGGGYGISATHQKNIVIKNCVVSGFYNGKGIEFWNVTNSKILSSTVRSNFKGIHIASKSEFNEVSDSTFLQNKWSIDIDSSYDNTIFSNTISSDYDSSIKVYMSSRNTISSNVITGAPFGIWLRSASYNNIYSNVIKGSTNAGMNVYASYNHNKIYDNFFNNTLNLLFSNMYGNNIWNIAKTSGTNIIFGPYLGGNFWANPVGNGFSQTCNDLDSDGICDAKYSTGYGYDNLPLAIIGNVNCVDSDGDGYSATGSTCGAVDCEDSLATINPGATEVCDGVDNDCDGTVDEVCECQVGQTRSCGSNVGVCEFGSESCVNGFWSDTCDGDIEPNTETCDGIDNDCDGSIDEGLVLPAYFDNDGDGYGLSSASPSYYCPPLPTNYVSIDGDCNDADAKINSGMSEACDGVDNDCDGLIDEGCRALNCGDIVSEDTILTQDILNCAGMGLVINSSDITLDCAGHTISGAGNIGIDMSRSTKLENVNIKNCNIIGFTTGIDLAPNRALGFFDNYNHNINIECNGAYIVGNSDSIVNYGSGILLTNFWNSNITGCVIADFYWGIRADKGAWNALIDENSIISNFMGLSFGPRSDFNDNCDIYNNYVCSNGPVINGADIEVFENDNNVGDANACTQVANWNDLGDAPYCGDVGCCYWCQNDDDKDGIPNYGAVHLGDLSGCEPGSNSCHPMTVGYVHTLTDNCIDIDNVLQTNSDSDGFGDACDNCINIANPNQADLDEDGIGDVCDEDSDADGILNAVDNCADVSNPTQLDSDMDGVGNACDNCVSVANLDQADGDNDGIGDVCDNCAEASNSNQLNSDSDNLGDACDNCVSRDNEDQADADSDGRGDGCDNCDNVPNWYQGDEDKDGFGDACDWDNDNDGIWDDGDNSGSTIDNKCLNLETVNCDDNCRLIPNPLQEDIDDDGYGNACDNDNDNDMVDNHLDNCPFKSNTFQEDLDNDDVGNACDNCIAIQNPDQSDVDGDGIGDLCDDDDSDGILDINDNCKFYSNPLQENWDADDEGDACDCHDGFWGDNEEGADCGGICSGTCNEQCVPLINYGPADDKINIVIIPAEDYWRYNGSGANFDFNEFKEDALTAIKNGYYAEKVINASKYAINFYLYPETADFDIVYNSEYNYNDCEWEAPPNWKSDCPGATQGAILHIASCRDYSSNGVFSAERDSFGTLVHESGHGVFTLGDEYDDEPTGCGTNYHRSQDREKSGTWTTSFGCQQYSEKGYMCNKFTTCDLGWYKSQPDGHIMENNNISEGWGYDTIRQVTDILYHHNIETIYGDSYEGMPGVPTHDKVLVMTFSYDGDNIVLLESNVNYGTAYLRPADFDGLGFTVTDSADFVVEDFIISEPRYKEYPPQPDLNLSGSGELLPQAEFTVVIPFFNNTKTIEITDVSTNETIKEIDVVAPIVDFCVENPEDEQCQTYDSDGDGIPTVDETCEDYDLDGYGTGLNGNVDCTPGTEIDCNDNDASINPGASEVCDTIDNNCDGVIDETGDALCDDGLFCNGVEVCSGTCLAGTSPVADDLVGCTDDSCDENMDLIVNTPNNLYCGDSGWYEMNDPYWIDVSDCDRELRQDREYKNYYCGSLLGCQFDIVNSDYVVVSYEDNDEDDDGVCDAGDKCLGTADWFAEKELKPNHYDSSNWAVADSLGCSCEQVLLCKPGSNNGEFKFGCSEGTMGIWEAQSEESWALDCQVDGLVTQGLSKPLFENTDDDFWIDGFDGDNDGDGTGDSDDDMIDDKDLPGDPDHGIPDWHPKSKHKK